MIYCSWLILHLHSPSLLETVARASIMCMEVHQQLQHLLLPVRVTLKMLLHRMSVWMMVEPELSQRFQLEDQDTPAPSVASNTRLHQICPVTSRRTERWILATLADVTCAVKRTWACQLLPCMFSRITWTINAECAGKRSLDPGYYKATWDPTRERNLSGVLIVARHLLIDPIYAPTCKHILSWRTSSARDATSPSLSSLIWTNTTNLHATEKVYALKATITPTLDDAFLRLYRPFERLWTYFHQYQKVRI